MIEKYERLFPTHRPALIAGTVLVIASAYASWQYYIAWAWNGDEHIRAECTVVGELAKELAETRILEEPAIANARRDFSADIIGSPYNGSFQNWPLWVQGAVELFAAPPAISCRDEFLKQSIVLADSALPLGGPPGLERFYFSRAAISSNGRSVSVGICMWCGDLCGYGWRTIWQRQNGRWVMTQRYFLWIS